MAATDIPLPYVCPINLEKERKVTHKYCREVSNSTSILKKDKDGMVIEETIETKTYTKDHEVELIRYSCKPTEDLEHLFEVIDTIRQEQMMAKPWKEEAAAAEAQTNNAQLLFDALNLVLQHDAASEWKISINLMEETFKEATPKCDVCSWRAFQTSVGHLICRIDGENLYGQHMTYLQATKKPKDLTALDWIDRLKTLNAYLPFCIVIEQNRKWNRYIQIALKTNGGR
jgi:hypothetical protein